MEKQKFAVISNGCYHVRTNLSNGTVDHYYAGCNDNDFAAQAIIGSLPITTRDKLIEKIVELTVKYPEVFSKKDLDISDINRGYKI